MDVEYHSPSLTKCNIDFWLWFLFQHHHPHIKLRSLNSIVLGCVRPNLYAIYLWSNRHEYDNIWLCLYKAKIYHTRAAYTIFMTSNGGHNQMYFSWHTNKRMKWTKKPKIYKVLFNFTNKNLIPDKQFSFMATKKAGKRCRRDMEE